MEPNRSPVLFSVFLFSFIQCAHFSTISGLEFESIDETVKDFLFKRLSGMNLVQIQAQRFIRVRSFQSRFYSFFRHKIL